MMSLDDVFTCHERKLGRHFFPSCSEVNSAGYSEFLIQQFVTLSKYGHDALDICHP